MNKRINERFGTNFHITKLEPPKNLPIYMVIGRNFYSLTDKEINSILVEIINEERFGIIAYEKQLREYSNLYNLPIAYWFHNMNRTQRESLLSKRIPFVDEKKMYLPYLGIVFTNNFIHETSRKTDKMMPVTQSLFIYLALILKGQRIIKKEAAKYLRVTQTSLTRASEQLLKMGLICQEKQGKDYYMWIEEVNYDLFLKAKPFLINPVQKTVFVEVHKESGDLPIAGESALSKRSMLSEPDVLTVAQFKSKKYQWEQVDERWNTGKMLTRIELWKYNPSLLAIDGLVDPISLYMSLKNSFDERIESELEMMMEEYKW